MESFRVNSAKTYIGKNVNLHLKDGSVIVNVHLTNIKRENLGKNSLLEYMPYGNRKSSKVRLHNVAWAELLHQFDFGRRLKLHRPLNNPEISG